MNTYLFLQHYWWLLISLLGGILVFLLFVQGGQGLLIQLGRNKAQRSLLITALGHKWGLTFTTLVTFGGAFFASFPLFYSTSFGGAFYVWMAILLLFVIQAVSYEFYLKPNNFLGDKTYTWFLILNGVLGALLLGVAVGTLFTGANFVVNRDAITFLGGNMTISQWTTPWKGLEAVLDYRNLLLGLTVVFLSRTLASQFFINMIDDKELVERSRRQLLWNALPFVLFFLSFAGALLCSSGYGVDPATGAVSLVPYKFFGNLLANPVLLVTLLGGVVLVLWGIVNDLFLKGSRGIWLSGIGTVLTVTTLLLLAGWNNTCYYPSLADMQSSLTIYNSSSSEMTLTVMSWVSLLIPIVVAYILYTCHQMNRRKISTRDVGEY